MPKYLFASEDLARCASYYRVVQKNCTKLMTP